ncbi:MFS transporter [Amycolatopsis viridis]|uniref:DHA1 family inner membrane transport protein n=1 Tax=Amycolatopsis viridis TaxID=185678 RepID=A0ABX0SMX2_9PSEU|nr:MFS transporter [Amycolatopsis viridis]NIH78312.1 DHA1 family inner membrane transport protein [Amycolatopsis viridis]
MPLPVFSLMLVVFGLTTGEFVIAGLVPDVAADLAVSVPSAGLLVTAYAAGMIIGGPVITPLTARVGRKPLITGLVAVSVVANLGSAVAPGYAVLLLARFVAGLIVATFFALAISITAASAPEGKQAAMIAKVALGLNLGIILGTPLGTFVGHHFGWRATFVAVAVITFLALLLVLRFVPAFPGSDASVFGELRVLADREVWRGIALTALGNLGVVTVFTYIVPLLTDVAGFSVDAVPVLLLVYGAGAVIGNLVGGRLADRALMPSLAWMLAALVATLALLWAAGDNRAVVAVLVFVLGGLAFAIVPGMQTRVLTAAGAAPTLAVAVNASGFQLAAAFGGWLGGQLINGSGIGALYPAAAVVTVAGLGLAVAMLRSDQRVRVRG